MFLSLPVPALSPPALGNLLAWDGGKYEPSLTLTWVGSTLTIDAPLGYTANLIDLKINGSSWFNVSNQGNGTGSGVINVSGALSGNGAISFTQTTASSSGTSVNYLGYVDDGAAMASGDRLVVYTAGGAKDAAHSLVNSGGLAFFAGEAWGAGAAGTYAAVQLCAAGATSRTERARFTMAGNFLVGVTVETGLTGSGGVSIGSTTASTTSATGALIVGGGIGAGGNITLAAAKTITAPGGLIIGNETLDTYDEGTWTPTISCSGTAGSNTYTTQVGYYVKIGKIVQAFFRIDMSVKDGAMAGNLRLSNLPFASSASANMKAGGNVFYTTNIAWTNQLAFGIGTSSTFAEFFDLSKTVATAAAALTDASVAAGLILMGSLTYET